MTQVIGLENFQTSMVNHLPDSLQHLIFLLSQTKNLNPSQVAQSLQEAQIQQEDLMSWKNI